VNQYFTTLLDSVVTANPLNSKSLGNGVFDPMLFNSSIPLNITTALTLWQQLNMVGFYGADSWSTGGTLLWPVVKSNKLSKFSIYYYGARLLVCC
jgi:hypothetical protein